jgi:hypothetical protein
MEFTGRTEQQAKVSWRNWDCIIKPPTPPSHHVLPYVQPVQHGPTILNDNDAQNTYDADEPYNTIIIPRFIIKCIRTSVTPWDHLSQEQRIRLER